MPSDETRMIAEIRHIAWVGFQIAAKQPYNEVPTPEQLVAMENGVRFALAHPDMTPAENHVNWMEMKAKQGWVYGPVKDFAKKTHPDMVPFDQLPEIEQLKDVMDRLCNKLAVDLLKRLKGPAGEAK